MSFKPYIILSLIYFACSCDNENVIKELGDTNNADAYQEPLNMVDTSDLQSLQEYLKREQYGSVPVIFDSLHSHNFEEVRYIKQGDKFVRVKSDSAVR